MVPTCPPEGWEAGSSPLVPSPTGQMLPQELLIALYFLAVQKHGLSKLSMASRMSRGIQQMKLCDKQGVGLQWDAPY